MDVADSSCKEIDRQHPKGVSLLSFFLLLFLLLSFYSSTLIITIIITTTTTTNSPTISTKLITWPLYFCIGLYCARKVKDLGKKQHLGFEENKTWANEREHFSYRFPLSPLYVSGFFPVVHLACVNVSVKVCDTFFKRLCSPDKEKRKKNFSLVTIFHLVRSCVVFCCRDLVKKQKQIRQWRKEKKIAEEFKFFPI